MKQFKPVIITAIICVVLAGAMFAIFKWLPEKAKEPPAKPISTNGSIYIIQKSANSVESVDVKTDEGEKFTIEYSIDEQGEQVAKLKGADKRFLYDTDEMYTLAGYLGILAAVEEIPDADGRDAEFGFKDPKREITVHFTDGDKIQLLIGADSPLGEGVYIKRVDTKSVYLIGGSTTEMLMRTVRDYRLVALFDKLNDPESVISVSITKPGEDKFTVKQKEDPEPVTESNPYAAQYEITEPVTADANNDPVTEKLLTPLIGIEIKQFVEDDPKDLKQYGLDKPILVEFTTNAHDTISFKIGAKTVDGGRYVMRTDLPTVMETTEDIGWDSLTYTDLMMQLLWLHNMDTVSQIQYRLPNGSNHTLEVNVVNNEIQAKFDGGGITSDNANNLFLLSVRFSLQGAIDSSMKYGDPDLELYMTLKDGKKTSLKLAQINERQYAAIVDDQPARFYVNVNEVKELLNAFDTLASGGTIPAMF